MKTITKRQAISWGGKQRTKRNQGKLKPHEIKSLDEIGFEWDPLESKWNTQFKELSSLDNPNVVTSSHELGNWVHKQRAAYKKGKLNAERIKLLEGIGLIWDMDESKWNTQFKELSKLDNPNVVTRSHELGIWVNHQRTAYKKGKLSTERIKLLEGIGLIWDPRESIWNTKFEEVSELDNPNVSQSHELGTWVNHQRTAYKKGKLSTGRIKLLEGIGIKWSMNN